MEQKLERMIEWWRSQASQYQTLATGCLDHDQGIRYSEKAAGYRRAANDIQHLLDVQTGRRR